MLSSHSHLPLTPSPAPCPWNGPSVAPCVRRYENMKLLLFAAFIGGDLFEMRVFHMGIAPQGGRLQGLARIVWSTFSTSKWAICCFMRGQMACLDGLCTF